MDYGKRDKYIVLSGLNPAEFFCMLKTQINCTLVFTDNTGKREFIDLSTRTVENNEQVVMCAYAIDGNKSTKSTAKYSEIIELVKELQATKKFSIEILKADFQKKESIIALWGQMNTDVIENCIYVDYDAELAMFALVNKPKNRKPEELYFFEDTEELLVFSKDGPKIYKKFTNVEDILC